jgi:hypothetical protein
MHIPCIQNISLLGIFLYAYVITCNGEYWFRTSPSSVLKQCTFKIFLPVVLETVFVHLKLW